jgi:hypothetical protein
MARALMAVGAALALSLIALGLAVYLTRDEESVAVDNLLAEEISRAVGTAETGGSGVVDLRRVAKFEWDELLIAERTATRGEIARALGHEWKGQLSFQTGDLLIFLRDGKAARFADYRGEGRFEGIRRPVARFDRDEAVFTVRSLVIRPRGSPRG